jgi:hypothetical protein
MARGAAGVLGGIEGGDPGRLRIWLCELLKARVRVLPGEPPQFVVFDFFPSGS